MKQFILVLLFFSTIVYAQKNVEFTDKNFADNKTGLKTAKENLKKADELFSYGVQAYEEALKYYIKANEFNPNNAYVNFQIAEIYTKLNQIHIAADYYEKSIALDPSYNSKAVYPLAQDLHKDGQWDRAIDYYEQYTKILDGPEGKNITYKNMFGTIEQEKKDVQMYIMQCNNAKKFGKDSIPVILVNMGDRVNSKYPDYTAVVNAQDNTMVYTSRRPTNIGDALDPNSPYKYEDVYIATRNADGTWGSGLQIKGDVNGPDHDAACWISSKGDKIIIYVNEDLYESELKGSTWSKPEPLKMINSKFRETHACYTPDGNSIYFTTNNPKWATKGGMDICVVHKDSKGKWSEPEEVDELNTIYNEESPFVKSDGKTMYFSSEGHTSIGGYDIFKTFLKDDGHFETPLSVGFPINSTSNDVYIFFTEDGKKAYFDSDRKGGKGEKDIYEMYILNEISLPLSIEVYDETTNELITSKVNVLEKAYVPVKVDLNNPSAGLFDSKIGVSKNYTLDASADGYEPKSLSFNTRFEGIPNFDTVKVKKIIKLKPIITSVKMMCDLKDKKTLKILDGEVEINNNGVQIAKLNTVNGHTEYKLQINTDYEVVVLVPGYKIVKQTIRFTENDLSKVIYLNNIELEEYEVGDKFVLKNIYFDYNKSNLRAESFTELNILKEFLTQNPSLKVEVSAHTDSRGSASYNYKLSDSRAESVVEWLISNGIPSSRLVSKGYGFDQPIAPNDTEDNMQLNRRVEFKIIK